LSASELSLRPLVFSYLPQICLALIASIQQFQLEGLGAGPQGNRLAHTWIGEWSRHQPVE